MNLLKNAISSFKSFNSEKQLICEQVWHEISDDVQRNKLTQNNIFDLNLREEIILQLRRRPSLLVHIADFAKKSGLEINTFVEVGTAQGLQSIMFAKTFPDSSVFTCDIKDDRDKTFSENLNINFVLGNSKKLCASLAENKKIDFCWIDGAHDHYDVINDFISLFSKSNRDTIWAFDDYDKRFGCFHDINLLMSHFEEHVVVDLGLTASGNPNRIAIMRGFI